MVDVKVGETAKNESEMYLCTSVAMPEGHMNLIGIQPTSKEEFVHHMLLFGAYIFSKQRLCVTVAGTASCCFYIWFVSHMLLLSIIAFLMQQHFISEQTCEV